MIVMRGRDGMEDDCVHGKFGFAMGTAWEEGGRGSEIQGNIGDVLGDGQVEMATLGVCRRCTSSGYQ